MSHVLIVGTGRSGTTYAQAVLRVCGVQCSHQKVFTWDCYRTRDWDWGDSEAEASFMAVPVLDTVRQREPDTKIILIVRDHYHVASSWIRRGLFGQDMAVTYPQMTEVLNDMFPHVLAQPTAADRALAYAKAWDEYAATRCDAMFAISTMSLPAFFIACGYEQHYDEVLAKSISATINSDQPS